MPDHFSGVCTLPSLRLTASDRQNELQVTLYSDQGLVRVYDYYATSGDGAAEGKLQYEKIKEGTAGSEITLKKLEYTSHTAGGVTVHPVSREISYRSDDGSGAIETAYGYSFHPGTTQALEKTTTLPAVSAGQNGPGTSATRVERFDIFGNLRWLKDERGFITYHEYDAVTGARTKTIRDVDDARLAVPDGWSTPAGGGLHLVSDYWHDRLGRITQELGPEHDAGGTTVRTAQWTVYKDADREIRSARGYAVPEASQPSSPGGSSCSAAWNEEPDGYFHTLVNPVSIIKHDGDGRQVEAIQAVRGSTDGKLVASDVFDQSSYVRWTTHQHNAAGQLVSTRVYHTIPASGAGTSGANYDETTFTYDASGRQNRVKTPSGTITRTVFDCLGNPTATYVGTDDTAATDSDPTGGGAQGNNMVVVTERQYDSGCGGCGSGGSLLTELTERVDASTTRVTAYDYDWRQRLVEIDGEEDFFEKRYYDNLARVVKVERYDTTAQGNLVARSETLLDDLGRVYRTKRYAVDPATGDVGNALVSDTCYDAAGNNRPRP